MNRSGTAAPRSDTEAWMDDDPRTDDALPRAKKSHHKFTRLFWLVPALGLAYLAWLLYQDWSREGHVIEITFPEAPGVMPDKTRLQLRGIEVGTVIGAKLDDAQGVLVRVQLDAASEAQVARRGSEFWVVQPEIGLQGFQGLEALVSGTYLQVRPGDGPPARHFVGLKSAPAVTVPDPGLRVMLLTDRVGSAEKGSPVLYRKVQIGEVARTELSDDARAVELHLHIEPRYVPLVRENSVFWDAGHLQLDVGLLGADIDVPAFQRLVSGAIAMATPDPPGAPAAPGTAYVLYPESKDEWLQWAPRIELRQRQRPDPAEVGHAR